MDGTRSRSLCTVTNVTRTVFYAWQSDCPSTTNWGFIRKALDRAVERLNQDGYGIEVDQGTVGVPGMPDITNEILNKIEQCAGFVADVTLVGTVDEAGSAKRLSNPSVMYELGYARKVHGEKRIVALVNKAFGRVEDLPFDIRSARVSTYTRHRTKADGDTEPKQLADLLYKSLKAVLDEPIPEKELPETNPADLLTRLLPKSDGDIEVELLIKKHADALVTQMSDEERFPLANSIASDIPARNRYLADQANLHIEASLPLCELLGMGVAFGGSRHDHIWRRTVEDIGNVASQPRTGVDMSLLDLLYLPMLIEPAPPQPEPHTRAAGVLGTTPAAGRGSSPTRRACTPRRCTASASLRDWAASTEATAAPARPPNRCAMSAKRLVRWCTSTSRNSQRSPTAAAGAPTDEATPDPANARDGATSTPP